MLLCLQVTVVTSSRATAGSSPALFVTLSGSKGPPVTSTPSSRATTAAGKAASTAANPATAAPGNAHNMASTGRLELKAAGGGQGAQLLEPGGSSSFVLQAVRSLGQLRQLLLEVEPSGQDKQVGGVPAQT